MAEQQKGDKVQISFRIDADLHKRFKKLCIDNDINMKDYITKLITKELEEKENE